MATPTHSQPAPYADPRRWWVLAACCTVAFAQMAEPYLWMIGFEVPASAFGAAWRDYRIVANLGVVLFIAFQLVGGVLGDLLDRRRVFLVGAIGTTAFRPGLPGGLVLAELLLLRGPAGRPGGDELRDQPCHVEYILIAFPGSKFSGQIAPALQELVANGTIQIIDLLFIKKYADGTLLVAELDTADADEAAPFVELEGEYGGLLTQEDIELAAAELPPNSSAGLLVWENVWAARFAETVRAANGQVIANGRVPHAVVEAALAAALADA